MKIEYIQNVNAVQSLSDLIMELRIACFGKHLKNWIWMLVMPHGFTNPEVGECECGSQKAHDTLGIKYDSFEAILKNFG